MFNEYKQVYKECADLAPGWEKLSFTELCDKYIEYKGVNKWLAESYFSALVYTCWTKMEMLYRTSGFNFPNCYSIVIDTLLYITDNHVWNDESNDLYKNSEGARIAFNTVLRSFENREKTRMNTLHLEMANTKAMSLDEMVDMSLEKDGRGSNILSDSHLIENFNHSDEFVYGWIVKEFFTKKDYFSAVLVDMLTQGYGFENKPTSKHATGYNKRELITAIYRLDEQYCEYFSKRYKVDYVEILDGVKFIISHTHFKMEENIKRTFKILRQKYFFGMKQYIGECGSV